jgi:hypothetical protein
MKLKYELKFIQPLKRYDQIIKEGNKFFDKPSSVSFPAGSKRVSW